MHALLKLLNETAEMKNLSELDTYLAESTTPTTKNQIQSNQVLMATKQVMHLAL